MNKKTPKVYLCGPIQHVDDGGHGWRDAVVENHPEFEFLNPLDFFDGGEDIATILPEDMLEERSIPEDEFAISDEKLVRKDKQMVRKADALLIGFPEKCPTWGTPMEQAFAWGMGQGNKVISLWHGDIDYESLSPWLRYHSHFASNDLNDSVQYLKAQFSLLSLCVKCRSDAGVEVTNCTFKILDENCEECGEHFAMAPGGYGTGKTMNND